MTRTAERGQARTYGGGGGVIFSLPSQNGIGLRKRTRARAKRSNLEDLEIGLNLGEHVRAILIVYLA
jgi:hypothetical protein